MLHSVITENGGRSIIVRGDGTRDGLGLSEGDPYSDEWQARSRRVKSPEGNTVEAWNAASYVLMRELSDYRKSDEYDAVIVDRTVLSRAAFLLHRGIALEGERISLDELYPDNLTGDHESIDLAGTLPEIIFELNAPSPTDLLARLDSEDPKYTFRSRNIRGGFNPASIARGHLPEDIEKRVAIVDASKEITEVHEEVRRVLGSTALGTFLN
jgi:thymidylate kinase